MPRKDRWPLSPTTANSRCCEARKLFQKVRGQVSIPPPWRGPHRSSQPAVLCRRASTRRETAPQSSTNYRSSSRTSSRLKLKRGCKDVEVGSTCFVARIRSGDGRSEEHTSELQSQSNLV